MMLNLDSNVRMDSIAYVMGDGSRSISIEEVHPAPLSHVWTLHFECFVIDSIDVGIIKRTGQQCNEFNNICSFEVKCLWQIWKLSFIYKTRICQNPII